MTWETAIKRMHIPKMYWDVQINKVNAGIATIGKEWVTSSPMPSLYLTGNPGSGKTYFSYCLLRQLTELNRYPWIIFVRSDELDEELLQAVESRNEGAVLEKYTEVPILFIDDLGVERVNERIIKQYYRIIDNRLSNYMTTVFTSNLSLEGISKSLGDRIASRLKMATHITFPNKDLRNEL